MKNKYKIINELIYVEIESKDENSPKRFVTSKKFFEKLKELNVKWYSKISKTSISKYYICASLYMGITNKKPRYKTIYLHRYLLDAKPKEHVDHINHDTMINTEENLRLTTQSNNNKHRVEKNSNNTSGYRNVTWIRGYWRVQLQVKGKNKLFPEKFKDVNKAGEFAEEMRQKYYGEYKGNN